MHVERLNRPVFELDDTHPAKSFLLAFIECRSECVGRELAPPGETIDQKWTSVVDGCDWTFSAFAYKYLSTDIELDGFLAAGVQLTESERWAIDAVPRFRSLMQECALAAKQSGNTDCLELIDAVTRLLDRWDDYLRFRQVESATS